MRQEIDIFEDESVDELNFDSLLRPVSSNEIDIVSFLDTHPDVVDFDIAAGKRFIVIAEIKPEMYHVFINDMFQVQGGRRITQFPETLWGARKLADELLKKTAIYKTEKITDDEGDVVKIVETNEILDYRFIVVETHNPTMLAPHHRDLVPDEVVIPELDEKITTRSKIFHLYLAAHKKKWDINRFAKAAAAHYNRKYNGTWARAFNKLMLRLKDAVLADEKMQAILVKWHGKKTLPSLGTIQIPHRKLKEYQYHANTRETWASRQTVNDIISGEKHLAESFLVALAHVTHTDGGEIFIPDTIERFDRENNKTYQEIVAKRIVVAAPTEMSIKVSECRKNETFVLGGDLWTMGETVYVSDDDGVSPAQYWAIPETGEKRTVNKQPVELPFDKIVLVVR